MISKRIEEQRRVIESMLMTIVGSSQEADSMMSKEKHSRGLVYRSLGTKKGWVLHYKNGGFTGEYTDKTGQKYEITVAPRD